MPLKCYNYADMEEQINLGTWSSERLDALLRKASAMSRTEDQIDFLSGQFIHIPYKENTLIGSLNNPEIFVINLEAVDCFTFIDNVEAMRLSKSYDEYKDRLKNIRYQDGAVDFRKRNHFFITWREYNSDFVEDVTKIISRSVQVDKKLNDRGDGMFYLPGIACINSTIDYFPSESIDNRVIDKLETGDYIGIYSDKPGLDVSHVGIVIRDNDKAFLRHASQTHQKVIDEDLKEYIINKPGIIVLRPKIIKIRTKN